MVEVFSEDFVGKLFWFFLCHLLVEFSFPGIVVDSWCFANGYFLWSIHPFLFAEALEDSFVWCMLFLFELCILKRMAYLLFRGQNCLTLNIIDDLIAGRIMGMLSSFFLELMLFPVFNSWIVFYLLKNDMISSKQICITFVHAMNTLRYIILCGMRNQFSEENLSRVVWGMLSGHSPKMKDTIPSLNWRSRSWIFFLLWMIAIFL